MGVCNGVPSYSAHPKAWPTVARECLQDTPQALVAGSQDDVDI